MIRSATTLAAILAAGPASADPSFPAVDCAALWAATARFGKGDAQDDAPAMAAQGMTDIFRDAAVARSGDDPAVVDARIAELEPVYLLLLERYILDGDRDSRDQHAWLMTLCQRFLEEEGLVAP